MLTQIIIRASMATTVKTVTKSVRQRNGASLKVPLKATLQNTVTRTFKRAVRPKSMPWRGLEPPHPCGYMTLNHACLPIPAPGQTVDDYHT